MNWYTFSLLILASIIGLLLLIIAAQTKLAEHKDEYIQALEGDNTHLRKELTEAKQAYAWGAMQHARAQRQRLQVPTTIKENQQ